MGQFRELSSDLTALDEHIAGLSGEVTPAERKMVRYSSLYRIYHISAEEIRHRFDESGPTALSAASIAAIRASLDGGLEIGRASCRGRVCQDVVISVGAGPLKKKQTIKKSK